MNNVQWMPLFGRFDIEGDTLRYVPVQDNEPETTNDSDTVVSTAQIASNVEFSQGNVSFDVKIRDPRSVCTVVLNTSQSQVPLHIGLNLGGAFGVAKFADSWDIVKAVGTSEVFRPQTYHVRVSVVGSSIQLYVNEVMVLETNEHVEKSPIHLYAQGQEEIVFSNFRSERPSVFVSLSEAAHSRFEPIITKILREMQLELVTVDTDYSPTEDVMSAITVSQAVIADATSSHPFGFYEIGYAHAIQRPTFVLCHRNERASFSLNGPLVTMLYYDESSMSEKSIEQALRRRLKAVD